MARLWDLRTRATTLLLIGLIGLVGSAGCGPSAADRAAASAAATAATVEEAARATARTAALEADRLRALWTYTNVSAGKGHQVAATIKSSNDVDTGGDAPHSVMLVFRDHPSWGRSSYLVLNSGDFRCAPTCAVTVAADDHAPQTIAAHRPNTPEAVALFINDWRAMWRATTGATHISVTFPVKAGGTRTATFDVGGLDPASMPGWSPKEGS